MRSVADPGRQPTWTGEIRRCLPVLVALLAVVALQGATLAHVAHGHPHGAGLEPSCVACQAPIGVAPVAPDVVPPAVRPEAPPVPPPAVLPPPAAPLSFSPKQSPPASA